MVLRLCTYPLIPWVDCTNNGYLGFDPNIIRIAFSGLRFRENVNYVIRCLDTKTEAIQALTNCSSILGCDAVFGDIVPDIDFAIENNVTYSYPYQCTSMVALVRSTSKRIGGIFSPFTWQLWLVLVSLPVVIGLVLTFLDWIIHKSFGEDRNLCSPSKFTEFVFDHSAMMLGQGDRHEIIRSHKKMYRSKFLCALRITIQLSFLTFAFLCFVMSSLYTAELTNLLIKRAPSIEYPTFDSLLETNNVLIPVSRTNYFQNRWNVNLSPYIFNNTESYTTAVSMLRNGTVNGIIGNRATLQWIQKLDTQCTVSIVPGSDVGYYGPVIAWSPCVTEDVKVAMNERIAELELDGTLEQVASTVIRDLSISGEPRERTCVSKTTTIGFSEVYLVFIILASGMSLPFTVIMWRFIYIGCGMLYKRIYKPILRNMKFVKSVKSMDSYESTSTES